MTGISINEIRKNAPVGATHYDRKTFDYYMVIISGAMTIPYLFKNGKYMHPKNMFLSLVSL